ncbi:MAG: LysM peptidoglycan-binding domain-containing protein [Tissierellia bacterium]|nr:LysM peptidoglycan-binding domain-containing protein [Tissierellia bacterium]
MIRYRIVNKKRFISFIMISIIFLLSIIFLFFQNNRVYSSTYKENYIVIKIIQGDTLWNIAMEYKPEGYDIRKMVFEIIEYNDIENVNIHPGDLIKVPIRYNPE